MNYWTNRNELKEMAVKHTLENRQKYGRQIERSVEGSEICSNYTESQGSFKSKFRTEIQIIQSNTVDAIGEYSKKANGKIAALNFASYKNPGGMFLNGSSAQEESLCHRSFLYEVLSSVSLAPFYQWNKWHLNRSLYSNRAIYSPDILFDDKFNCDILTCAAPNYSTVKKCDVVFKAENSAALKDRVNFALRCFANRNAETIILGAWGCGVFGQDANEVANLFKQALDDEFFGVFRTVIFAIPDSYNHAIFSQAFDEK